MIILDQGARLSWPVQRRIQTWTTNKNLATFTRKVVPYNKMRPTHWSHTQQTHHMPATNHQQEKTIDSLLRQIIIDLIVITKNSKWADGHQFFDMTTSRFCLLLNPMRGKVHNSIKKWKSITTWRPKTKVLWMIIWDSCYPKKETCFIWQVLLCIPTTNRWRLSKFPDLDERR